MFLCMSCNFISFETIIFVLGYSDFFSFSLLFFWGVGVSKSHRFTVQCHFEVSKPLFVVIIGSINGCAVSIFCFAFFSVFF